MAVPSPRLHAMAASFWREWYRELRHHAGNERLPYPLRTTLRGAADRALERAAVEAGRAVAPRWSRRAASAAAPVRLPAAEEQRARALASTRGIPVDRPIVAIEIGLRQDLLAGALDLLAREGFHTVPIDPSMPTLVDRWVLQTSAFVIGLTAELQRAACDAHTPSLRLDARDPFTAYPLRSNSLFTLATVIDLDTGRVLPAGDLLTEHYFRHTRNYGYRGTSAGGVAAAAAEMVDGVRTGWRETPAQAAFRRAVEAAGAALGARVRHVIEWDAADGFVGDGRLARVQAEQAA